MHKCRDRVEATRGLGVGGACVQGSRLASGTRHRFTGSGAAQTQAHRTDDGLAEGATGKTKVIDHGDQGAAHDAAGSPPQVTPVVACHQE